MSSSNLDLVRSIYADWECGDFSSTEWADPEIEFVFADGPSPGRWKGIAGMAGAWLDFLSAWEAYTAFAEEYRELDHERVLALTAFNARGKTSGLEVREMRAQGASLQHIGGGKVVRLALYFNRQNALADLGLAPQGGVTN
jgi:hypothetical protein